MGYVLIHIPAAGKGIAVAVNLLGGLGTGCIASSLVLSVLISAIFFSGYRIRENTLEQAGKIILKMVFFTPMIDISDDRKEVIKLPGKAGIMGEA
jgi:hypothetical protein